MLIEFDQEFELPVEAVYTYFRTPADWPRLYGSFGAVEDRGDGWFAVPLRRFPFPLVAKVTAAEPLRRVRWTFRDFWRGEGEVRFTPTHHGTRVQGYERIAMPALLGFGRVIEKAFLEARFEAVWDYGWRRLRRQASADRLPDSAAR